MDHESAIQSKAVERYLLGEMPLEERDSFEEHYFACTTCAEDIRLGSAMSRDVKAVLREGLPSRSWLGWLRVPVLVPTCATVALLAVVGYQNLVQLPGLRSPRAIGPAFILDGQTRSGVPLGVAAEGSLRVRTSLDAMTAADNLYVELLDASGRKRSSGEVPAPAAHRPLDVVFPGDFEPGRYVVLVREAASRKEITRSSLQIVPKSAVIDTPASTDLPESHVPVSKEIPDR